MTDMLIILNDTFESDTVIDVFESLIWTTRYKEAGDFELYTPLSLDLIDKLKVGAFLYERRFMNSSTNEAHLMIIESLELDEQHLKVTGRSLKSILERRIIWGQKVVKANTAVETAITEIITEAIVNPTIADRKISNFVFETPEANVWGTVEEDTQYDGNSILEVMNDFCDKYKLGYEVVYNFTDNKFHMRLTKPVDHSWEQLDNPPVVFSAKFNNLKSAKYLESSVSYKNVAYVSGEKYSDDDIDKYHQTAVIGSGVGLNRRELFVDASSIAHQTDDGTIYGTTSYQKMLEQKGQTELNKKDNAYQIVYEGEADNAANTYEFLRDYDIGDTVEVVTPYGKSATVRISEMVLNISTSGITFVPSFESIEEAEES